MSNGKDTKDKENLLLSHGVQNGPSCFLNSSSWKSLALAGSRLSSRVGQWLIANGINYFDFIKHSSSIHFSRNCCKYKESVLGKEASHSLR